MTLWLYVTKDKYELPLMVEESAAVLARKLGISANTIYSSMRHSKTKGYRCRFAKVVIEEKE